jgi:glucosylceramidase
VQAAMAVNPSIRFWASPWTPPTWMKQGPFQAGGVVSPFDGGTMKDDDATLAAFAAYLVRFARSYAEQGIAIEAVSAQNEAGNTTNYPSCGWSATVYTKFIGQYLGPALAAAGLSTKVMLGTFNGGSADGATLSGVLGDAVARSFVGVLGFQWGFQYMVSGARSQGLPIWQTEHQCGNYWWMPGYTTTAPNDQSYAVESWGLIRDWIKAGVTAYSAWNMVLDTVGNSIDSRQPWAQNALLAVDTSTQKLVVTPAFYVFRHISQFVAPGARVVATSGGDALAFKNPNGTIVTIVYNSGDASTFVVAVGGTKLQFAMPAYGWATVNYVP